MTSNPSAVYGSLTLSPTNSNSSVKWYLNMFCIHFVEFAAESSRGIVLATLFLYNKSLGGDLAFMGLLTSVFSIGRLISSMIFGWMCDRYTFKSVYIVSSSICVLGNLLYLLADPHSVGNKYLLLISRFVVGFGAGNRSVCRANVAHLTTVNQRLKWLNILATVVFLGYALTPGIGSTMAGFNFYVLGVHMNKFTAPGGVLILLNLITLLLIGFVFDEDINYNHAPVESPVPLKLQKRLSRTTMVPDKLVKVGVLVFIFLNFNARGVLSVFETVNIPLFLKATDQDLHSKIAVVQASNFQFYLGLVGLVTYFLIEILRNKISDVIWLISGFTSLTIGNIMLCFNADNLSFTRLITAEVFVWSIGCPITTAVTVATFSKILGGKPQGTMMGLLGSAASISRILLPLLPGMFATLTPIFIITTMLCILSAVVLIWYNNLVSKVKEDIVDDVIYSPVAPESPIHTQS